MAKVEDARLVKVAGRNYWYIEFYNDGVRHRITSNYKLNERAKADRYFAEWLNKQEQHQKDYHNSIADILDLYYEEKRLTIVNPTSMRCAIDRLKRSDFANLQPEHLRRQHWKDYRAQRLAEGRKDGTIAKELGIVRAAVRLINGVMLSVEMPPSQPPRVYYLTQDEVARLLDAAWGTPHIYFFIVLAYNTGARRGAILDLTWDRVRFDQGRTGYIHYADGKSHLTKGRATVSMNTAVREALQEAYQGRQTDHVIEYQGHRIYAVQTAWERVRDRAGLPKWVTPHILRHTAVTHMRAAGISFEAIAEVVGHTTPAVTRRVYSHVLPDTHAAVDVLSVNRSNVRKPDLSLINTETPPLAGKGRGSMVPKGREYRVKKG